MPKARCGPEVVRQQVAIEAFALSPDGSSVVYVRRHVEGNAYRSHIWRIAYSGGPAQQLTRGAARDSSPSFSPDGSQLAFVRTAEGEDEGQVWLLDLAGEEPSQLSRLPDGAAEVSWSPDGRLLAILAASDDTPFIEGPLERGKEPRVRRIRRLDWRDDDVGHRDRRTHLYLLEPQPGSTARQLTRGDFDVQNPAWSPDSLRIAFSADQRDERDLDPRTSIWAVDVSGGDPREVAALAGDADFPSYSPDGRHLAFLGMDVADPPEYEPWIMWLAPAAGGEAVPLIEGRDTPVGVWTWTDLDMSREKPGPVWLADDSLGCLIALRARCRPYEISVDAGPPRPLADEDGLLASGMESRAGRLVISASLDGRAGELYAVEDQRLRRLTRDGSGWQTRYPLPRMEEFDIPGPAGLINTWLASPPDAGDAALPLILHFHGGPTGAYGPGGSLDAMVLTSAGYRVAMPNIRGSAGFGYDWAAQLRGRWGEVDTEDVFAVVDWLVARGLADPRRLGLTGYSYAGYLIERLVGITDRFAAAVAENGVANQVSSWANCYFGVAWNRRLALGDPLTEESMLHAWRSSPLSNVGDIRTPLLLLQAEDDRNCPAADSEQLFTALRTLGRETEYILYPEEHHEMKNYGRPDRRIDRHERILAWFARYFSSRR